jgi:trk system potassium uptake protein TrkH
MTWLDAIMHMFSHHGARRLFQPRRELWIFRFAAIEAVSIVFMLIAGCNFATHYVVLSGRSLRPYASDPEAGWFCW